MLKIGYLWIVVQLYLCNSRLLHGAFVNEKFRKLKSTNSSREKLFVILVCFPVRCRPSEMECILKEKNPVRVGSEV